MDRQIGCCLKLVVVHDREEDLFQEDRLILMDQDQFSKDLLAFQGHLDQLTLVRSSLSFVCLVA